MGGKANLSDVDCCATRLRVTVVDADKVNDAMLRQSGASGVVHKGNGIQVIYGPQVAVIKSNLVDYMESPASDAPAAVEAPAAPAPKAETPKEAVPAETFGAHLAGTVVAMADVEDEAFASGVLGDGVAVEPTEGKLYAPADATVDNLFDTHHAIGLVTEGGAELLLHIGIDTVKLSGQHFTAYVKNGQKVKKGDLLISFDIDAIKAAGYKVTTPMIVCNTERYAAVKTLAEGEVKPGQDLLRVE